MSAADIIQGLIKLGTSIQDAFTRAHTSSGVDLPTFLKTFADSKPDETITDLLSSLRGQDFKKAIVEIQTKQTALLRGRPIGALPLDELLQFQKLSDARLLLATANLEHALDPSFLDFLIERLGPAPWRAKR